MARRMIVAALGVAALLLSIAVGGTPAGAASRPVPIPGLPAPGPAFLGAPATADPVAGIPPVPQNPYLAPNGDSNIHDDGWQSNTYDRLGPLGDNLEVASSFLAAECASINFDSAGRIVATCIGPGTAALYLFDPTTLATRGRYPL